MVTFTDEHHVVSDDGAMERLLGPNPEVFDDERDQWDPVRFDLVRLPDVVLPDGLVAACDPRCTSDPQAFSKHMAQGAHPLHLVRIVDENPDLHHCVALAALGRIDLPIEVYTFAGDYPVDSGLGCFLSPRAGALLKQYAADDACFFELGAWASAQSPDGSMAVFSTGFGDGVYRTYFGSDRDGAVVLVITDFNIVSWEREPDDDE